MIYTAEVRLADADFSTVLCEMRTWLDHHRFEPESFRQLSRDGGVRFLVDFKSEGEAQAFAKAFGGGAPGAPLQAELS